jgi:hypothetical protein
MRKIILAVAVAVASSPATACTDWRAIAEFDAIIAADDVRALKEGRTRVHTSVGESQVRDAKRRVGNNAENMRTARQRRVMPWTWHPTGQPLSPIGASHEDQQDRRCDPQRGLTGAAMRCKGS